MMRVTNNMISANNKSNINGNKVLVDKYNTQMTTQKKISKASEDPVIAIRSLRLSTTLSHLTQYLDNNIEDANSWIDITFTALNNTKKVLTDIHTQCVNGSNGHLTEEDRDTIYKSLNALVDQVYSDGDADYSGRTVFTGYRTNHNLKFMSDTDNTCYEIDQPLSYQKFETKKFYSEPIEVPNVVTTSTPKCDEPIRQTEYRTLRLGYGEIDKIKGISFTAGKGEMATKAVYEISGTDSSTGSSDPVSASYVDTVFADPKPGNAGLTPPPNYMDNGALGASDIKIFNTEEEWQKYCEDNGKIGKVVEDNEIVMIRQSGEMIFGTDIGDEVCKQNSTVGFVYEKTGFKGTEVRPEYYYDCIDITKCKDASGVLDKTSQLYKDNAIEYKYEHQDISYTVANSTEVVINTQAAGIFDPEIRRDVVEMVNVVQNSINAHKKVDDIKKMMAQSQYSSDETLTQTLQTYLDAAQKEADYADSNLQQTYENYVTKFDDYFANVNKAITNVGSTQSRLDLIQNRVENQQTTFKALKSSNEDRDISDIIIDYYQAYYAYQSSLTAAGKIGDQTLLNYI